MKKFLRLIIILAIMPMILATIGFLMLPSKVLAYIQNEKEIYISSFSIYYFGIIDLITSGISYYILNNWRKKYYDDQYPNKVTVFAYCSLILSILLNFATYLALEMFLSRIGRPIPLYMLRIFFTFVGIFSVLYGFYIRNANMKSEFAIKNRWSMYNDLIFGFSNKFSSYVFFAGGIFIIILSWIVPNLRQLYMTTMTVLFICGISSIYISKTIYKKYRSMYREKKN